MAGTVIADQLEAASTSTLVLKNGVSGTPPTVQDSAGTQIGTFCRAWVNFNGTGTVAIRASFNVTSITDNGNGNYAVNFTTAMPDANYAVVAIAGDTSSGTCLCQSPFNTSPTTTSAQVFVTNSAFSGTDRPLVYAAIFR
jgi:hypothetical protein